MSRNLSRRDFLKLSQLALPLALSLVTRGGSSADAARLGQGQQPAAQRPNILLVVFDSLSAQHMSLYGYPRSTTPNLEQFASRSTVYHAHYAAGNFTSPGTASILTGVYPWTHRAFNLASVTPADFSGKNLFAAFAGSNYHRLAYTHNRLADFLLNRYRSHIDSYIPRADFLLNDHQFFNRFFAGDRRIASISEELAFVRKNQSSLFLSLLERVLEPGLGRMRSQEIFPRGLPEAFRATFMLENAVDGINAHLSSAPQPFLGYFHLLPPHEPYRPRKEFKDRFEGSQNPDPKPAHFFSQNEPDAQLNRLRRSYDEYLAYADAEFGRLLALLEHSGLLKNTVVVFTADHGQLFERGIHGHITPVLYEPVIRVPLLVYDPNRPFRQDVYSPTSAVDILPTLLAISGEKTPDWCEGVVMPPYQTGAPDRARSIYVIEAKQNASNQPLSTATVAVIQDQTKLISYYGYPGMEGKLELYDLDRDQEERVDLVSVRKKTAAEIHAALETRLQAVNKRYLKHT